MKQASSIVLASRLMAEEAQVVGYDPLAMDAMKEVLPNMEYASSVDAALVGADACVLVTEWDEFLALDWNQAKNAMACPIIVDGRNALDGEKIKQLGFTYEGVGKKPSPPAPDV